MKYSDFLQARMIPEFSVNEPTDARLIELTLQGDLQAFDQLVLRHQDRLVHSLQHALGSREDALEIAQNAFVLAWRKLSTFRGDAAFYSWLYRIARNAAASRRRRTQIQTGSLDAIVEAAGLEPIDKRADISPHHGMDQAEDTFLVRQALQQVPEDFRQALVLKEIDGLSYEEIAEVLDIPLGTVRSRISRARHELAERLRRVVRDD